MELLCLGVSSQARGQEEEMLIVPVEIDQFAPSHDPPWNHERLDLTHEGERRGRQREEMGQRKMGWDWGRSLR